MSLISIQRQLKWIQRKLFNFAPLPISHMHSTSFRELTNLTPIWFSQMQTATGFSITRLHSLEV